MDHAARRPMLAVATLTTAGALALTPLAITPPELHAPSIAAARISTEAIQLTDAWSDLVSNTVTSVVELAGTYIGSNSTYPLPNPIFFAPIAAQLVINPLVYAAQLVTGQGAQIPTEIADHLSNIAKFADLVVSEVPPIVLQQIENPFVAAQLAINSITTATNKLVALLEAPALFLNVALNSQYGLIGYNGPLALPVIARNLFATAIAAAPPTIVLPLKKAAAAASTPKPTAAALTASAPSSAASSARSKPNAPATNGKRTTSSAKAGNSSAGSGHSKRG
ncbi:hypothetical protein [Mycolicibacterium helvum]|uniref:Uncharacterized protein n=1 Tax=Mycolicibacterium helvum TaxID=1534349 RepID=A0A7I7T7N6_9MYCO|nr:hypothetical protein [Mycolicibacterium helvum]BBY65237.1 hypothetical protein MHEL_34800 [Mycolicibacterium helvum]